LARKNATSIDIADIASGFGEISALVADPTGPFLYFAARGIAAASYVDGVVGRMLKSGGPPAVLACAGAPGGHRGHGNGRLLGQHLDGTIRHAPK
jgi:hypothetical protein